MCENYSTKIISEIIETEKSYLSQLEKLQKFFCEPSLEKGLLPNHVYSAVFGQLSTIYQMNSKLLEEISNGQNDIGSAFLKLGPFLKAYSSYANNFQRSLSLLQKWESENEGFRSFISTTETRPEVQSKLTALLITPIQRIPRYRLLLQELLKHSDSCGYSNIEGALHQIIEVAEHVNQSVDDSQTLNHILSLQKALRNQEPNIIAPGRKFIKEGILNKVSRKGKGSQARCFFLFSDILIYTKMPLQGAISPDSKANSKVFPKFELRSNSLECCCVLPLHHCRVTTLFGSSNQGITLRLQCVDEDLLLYSECASEGEDWVRAISESANDARRKRKTLRRESSCRKAVRPTRRRHLFPSKENSGSSPVTLSGGEVVSELSPGSDPKSPTSHKIFVKKDSLKLRLRNARDCLTPPKKFLIPKHQWEASNINPTARNHSRAGPRSLFVPKGATIPLSSVRIPPGPGSASSQNGSYRSVQAKSELTKLLHLSSPQKRKRQRPDLPSSPCVKGQRKVLKS